VTRALPCRAALLLLLLLLCLHQVDAAGFETAMEEARQKSRAGGRKAGVSASSASHALLYMWGGTALHFGHILSSFASIADVFVQ
jgi:hypothetical protein